VYELALGSMYVYDSQAHVGLFEHWQGVVVEGIGEKAMNFQVDAGWTPRNPPVIYWNKTDEYEWKDDLSYYTENGPTTTNTTNQTNSSNNTEINTTNEFASKNEICWENCLECDGDRCTECSAGFTLTNGTCEAEVSFAFISSLQSFPYSSMVLRLIFFQFMDEFWFYEYMDCNYSQPVKEIIAYIGNANRNKYIPPYVK
jgi:hypothetical protein